VLAHGGAAGAALEIAFLLVPVVIFVVLAWWSKRKQDTGRIDNPSSPAPDEE
jgi:hypothetical protein